MKSEPILISPEYIYGHKWGYKASSEEHRAIADIMIDAGKRWNIDSDRIYLYGHSQGGHATFTIGATQSEHFAGIVPVIGTTIFRSSRNNLRDIPVYNIGGSEDGNTPDITHKALPQISQWNAPFIYVEYTGRGHESFTEEWPRLAGWLSQQQRVSHPEKIHFTPLNKADDGAHWLRIQRWGRGQ